MDLAALDPVSHLTGVRRALVVPRDDVADDDASADRLAQRGIEVERAALPGYAAMMVDAHESVRAASRDRELDSVADVALHIGDGRRVETKRERIRSRWPARPKATVRESAVVFGDERRLFGVLSESMTPGRSRAAPGSFSRMRARSTRWGPAGRTWSSRASGPHSGSRFFAWTSAASETARRDSVPSTIIPTRTTRWRILPRRRGGWWTEAESVG